MCALVGRRLASSAPLYGVLQARTCFWTPPTCRAHQLRSSPEPSASDVVARRQQGEALPTVATPRLLPRRPPAVRLAGLYHPVPVWSLAFVTQPTHRPLYTSARNWHRPLCTSAGDWHRTTSPLADDDKDGEKEVRPSIFKRFKQMYKSYWYVMLPVHLATSTVWFGSFYYASKSGLDVAGILQSWGFSDIITNKLRDSAAGHLAVAYALYKIATPARYTVTLGGTTYTIKFLSERGYIKPVPSRQQLKDMYEDRREEFRDILQERRRSWREQFQQRRKRGWRKR